MPVMRRSDRDGRGAQDPQSPHYYCSLCASDYEPTLDELVEVTFTVNPRIRRIAAHDPDSLPFAEYMRQIFWSSSNELPDDVESAIQRVTLDTMELGPGEKAAMSLNSRTGLRSFSIRSPTPRSFSRSTGRRPRSGAICRWSSPTRMRTAARSRSSPAPRAFRSKTRLTRRTMPGIWLHSEEMDKLTSPRRPFLTATRLLSNQAFRDLYRSGTFDPEQRFKITSLTILFTDLRGSTALYDRIGDLAAFDLVRSHFGALSGGGLRGGRRGGQDHRRCGDGDLPDAGAGAARGDAHARGDAQDQRRRAAARTWRSISGCIRARASPSCSTTGRTISARRSTSPRASRSLADPTAILATKPIIESAEVAQRAQPNRAIGRRRGLRSFGGSAKSSKSSRFANARRPPRRSRWATSP